MVAQYGIFQRQHSEKLGPLVQSQLGDRVAVWPIAAGGWTEVNEAAYLERNPDVGSAANFFVWELMRGGLSQMNKWQGDYVFPSQRPLFVTWYVLRRYVVPRLMSFNVSELPPQGALTADNVERFEAAVAKLTQATGRKIPGILFLYAGEADLAASRRGEEWFPERREVEQIATKYGVRILDLSKRPEWSGAAYRDGTRPTVEANRLLARIIADAVIDAYKP